MVAFEIGDPSASTSRDFMVNLKGRMDGRSQMTTDDHKAYAEAGRDVIEGDVDYAQLEKLFDTPPQVKRTRDGILALIPIEKRRIVNKATKVVFGNPDKDRA